MPPKKDKRETTTDNTNTDKPEHQVKKPKRPTDNQSETQSLASQSTHIINPNVHLLITAIFGVILLGLSYHNVFVGPSPVITVNPIIQNLEKICPKGDIIKCIKDKLFSDILTDDTVKMWVGEIRNAFLTSEDFGSALQTLKSLHDEMTQNSQITFAGFHENLKTLKNDVGDIHDWKKSTLQQIKSLRGDVTHVQSSRNRIETLETKVQDLETDLEVQKEQPIYINRTIELYKKEIDLRDSIDKKDETAQLDMPDIITLQDNLTSQAVNLSSLAEVVEKLKEDTNKSLQTHWGVIQNIQDKELPEIRDDLGKTKNRVEDVNNIVVLNHAKTEKELLGHSSQITIMEGEIRTLSGSVRTQKTELATLSSKVDEYKEDADDKLKAVNGDLNTLRADLGIQERKLKDLSGEVDSYKEVTDTTLNNHNEKLLDIKETVIPVLEDEIKNANTKAETSQSDISQHRDWASEKQSEYERFRKDLESKQGQTVFKQSVSQEIIDEMRSKMLLHDISFYLGLFSIGCCVLMFMNSMKNKQRGWSRDMQATSGKQPKHRDNIDVYQLKWKGPVENSVCVVTFHSETERQHTTETKSMFESDGATLPVIHTRLIRRHTDIRDLPGSRIFLVFIDFNERNVILEDPNKGLGDLRVTTVRSLWKFGGDVTVIYCRDQGSRQLGGELFNRDLSSIYSQPELSQLKNQQRIMSIFEGFSGYQKEHCRDFINRQLKRA